jgi:mono/diheme cytochrome c family protein
MVTRLAARPAGQDPGAGPHTRGGDTNMKRFTTGLVVLAFAAAVAAPVLAQDAKVAKGQELFTAQKCMMCHSVEGKGNKNKPLDGVGSTLKPEDIKKWITTPKEMKADSKMKAYSSLSPEDLDALVAYISSLKKKD